MTLSWRKSLLVICKILWLFVDTLFAHDILLLSTDNLTQPTQMQLSKKQEILAEFFSSVLKSRSNFEHFEKQDDPHRSCISEIKDCERDG